MIKETIFEMSSPYRDKFRITGYCFGSGDKALALVGAMRGDEVQQQYICAQMVKRLAQLEQQGLLAPGQSILVIPSCNPFSMNVNRRFWAMDNTDINRMFPGFSQGETTQRIASAIFDTLQGYRYGIQLASYYVQGDFVPHVRMLQTGYEDVETARLFGMKYVTTCQPRPFDTTLLNYNWQLWDTRAFSLYAGQTSQIDLVSANESIDAILRMMQRTGLILSDSISSAYESTVLDERNLEHVKARHAGLYYCMVRPGQRISEGDSLAHVIHPYNGQILDDIKATTDGIVFFVHNRPVVFQNALLFMIHKL